MSLNFVPMLLLSFILMSTHAFAATVVSINTQLGEIQIEMLEEEAPLTVENFLNYVNRGDYDGSIFHRSQPGFVIQGGGFAYNSQTSQLDQLSQDSPVVNEFGVSNTRGTVAMAKLGGDPDSATNQWFINLADNSANLDSQNGGFTVFGRVAGDGMDVVDAIAALPRVNFGGAFAATPTIDYAVSDPVTADTFVTISQAAVITDANVTLSPDVVDDDNDGTINTEDAFPFDSSESIDTDGDGIGNNADNDDDGDTFTDAVELSAGSNPLDQNSPLGSYTGAWWNKSESGWGAFLIDQSGIIIATIYSYDASGLPTWYISGRCVLSGGACSAALVDVSGGTPLVNDWDGTNKQVTERGTVSFTFSDQFNAVMDVVIGDESTSKLIVRDIWQ